MWTQRSVVTVLLGLLASTAAAHGRTAVQRDVEGYAIAACLTKQKETYLRDQGDAWASVIVQRSEGDIEPFKSVSDAVDAELAKGNVALMRQESDPQHAKELPVLYCSEIIDEPAIATAIDKAIKKLSPSYRRRKK